MAIREHKHRLSKEHYRGFVSGSFTLCIKNGSELFSDDAVVKVFADILASVAGKEGCIVPAYCFMPDHQHIVLSGTAVDSDLWAVLRAYKQRTGYWLSRNRPEITWQKDFYDHIIRSDKSLATHVRYVLDNPVRSGLVTDWKDHPHKGSVGCSLEAVLGGML